MNSPYDRILKYFNYHHLPENLKSVSIQFYDLANFVVNHSSDEDVAETMVCLRKLLEAKDCAVRAALK